MEENLSKWRKGRQMVVSFLLATSMILSVTPIVHAENSQSTHTEDSKESSTEKIVTPDIVRYEGYSRDNVAERVASAHFSDSNKVIIVNREKFPDAISATNISQGKYPVLYTQEGKVSDSTIKLLKSMALDEIYVLGGKLSINDSVIKQLKKATKVDVTRIAGRSRYDANVSAVEKNFKQANHVVIASGEVYSDALYGVSYANTMDSPVILTNTKKLEASTIKLLKKLGVKNVTIIGGPLTVTKDVENQLKNLGIGHSRIAGRNRYIGSAEVATASYENPKNAVIASGEVFSDALVSAPLAQKLDAPILLVRNNRMEDVVENYLTENQLTLKNIYIQGGPLTILPETEKRIEDVITYLVKSDVLPYDTIEEEDETLLAGETKIAQIGTDGFEEIFYNVSYDQNGKEVSRKEISRNTLEPIPEIIKIGTRVDIESISLSEKELILEEKESYKLKATVLPNNATNKSLIWHSSDDKIITVDNEGTVVAHSVGEATVTVSDTSGKITNQLVITVKEPTIQSIEDFTINITQNDDYSLPTTVSAIMSNNTTKEVPVSWDTKEIDTSIIGTKTLNGTVEGYEGKVILNLIIEKYNPEVQTNAYSGVTINGVSKQLNLSIRNDGPKTVNIDKIEVYEQGKLYRTFTPEQLSEYGISTVITSKENWGMSISFKLGMWVNNSYVKYYVSANNTDYEYEAYLK